MNSNASILQQRFFLELVQRLDTLCVAKKKNMKRLLSRGTTLATMCQARAAHTFKLAPQKKEGDPYECGDHFIHRLFGYRGKPVVVVVVVVSSSSSSSSF